MWVGLLRMNGLWGVNGVERCFWSKWEGSSLLNRGIERQVDNSYSFT